MKLMSARLRDEFVKLTWPFGTAAHDAPEFAVANIVPAFPTAQPTHFEKSELSQVLVIEIARSVFGVEGAAARFQF